MIGIETVNVDENFQPISGTEQVMKADLVLLAMGFLGPETHFVRHLHVREIYDDYTTNNERVLVAGDAKRGPSLSDLAIREGRLAAEKVDQSLRALIYQQILAKTTGKNATDKTNKTEGYLCEKRCAILREGRIVQEA